MYLGSEIYLTAKLSQIYHPTGKKRYMYNHAFVHNMTMLYYYTEIIAHQGQVSTECIYFEYTCSK